MVAERLLDSLVLLLLVLAAVPFAPLALDIQPGLGAAILRTATTTFALVIPAAPASVVESSRRPRSSRYTHTRITWANPVHSRTGWWSYTS